MQKNTTYRQTIRRQNFLTAFVLGFFDKYSSSPRLMLEVFVRKNFGKFYFNMGSVLKVVLILSLLPLGLYRLLYSEVARQFNVGFWEKYTTWYLFIAGFLITSIIKWTETNKLSNNNEHLLNSPGEINPLFFKLELFGKPPSEKLITVVYEPLFFFIIGKILSAFGQQIGTLIMINSVFYSLGTYAEYWFANQYMDQQKFDVQQGGISKQIYEQNEMKVLTKKPSHGGDKNKIDSDTPTIAL